MTQIKEDIDGSDRHQPEEDVKPSATSDGSDREKKSIDLDKIYNRGNQILVYIAGSAAVGGFVSDGITTGAMIGAAVGAVAGAAVGIISVQSGKQDSEETP